MAEERRESKWEGKVVAEVRSITPQQVWPLLEDFCNVHKWLPTIDTSRHVEGVYGQPGLVRYCASTLSSLPSNGDDQTPTTVVNWCHEKLLSIDPVQRSLSYEITENNLGFTFYVAEWKVIELKGDDNAGGCRIEWSFSCNPVEGWKLEDFSGYIGSGLEGMAKRIEKELLVATS
ncbi:lachrymatory-factor synthase [Cynara cardunculus var. scolymus]|uniref:Polyketide cyclase/dehydrase n=1 Tax=Cynara cardunculus var. scolymus TaxID=59895 RepID=A0A103XZQ8_CYNCS|nr:lachrymatory-factor synthase [Cynara cardunculus var. scolymus]KVH99854.1 Polyketide cyclase/dehydrase [Cynara cardunculus var. scolymus]